jgi:hypothetical protein
MKVWKLGKMADNGDIIFDRPRYAKLSRVCAILTNLQVEDDRGAGSFEIWIGQGIAARKIKLEIPFSEHIWQRQQQQPTNINPFADSEDSADDAIFMFRNFLFYVENIYNDDATKEEIILTIKELAYSEDQKLKRLRQEVDAMERVLGGTRGVKREPIPDSVKLIVWTRDEGKCVRCGSSEKLHFDHIIPVVKGGGNMEDNIQILCEHCNLTKSDKIAF